MRANLRPPSISVAVTALRYDPQHRGFDLGFDTPWVQRQLRQRSLRVLLPEADAANFTGSALLVQRLRRTPHHWVILDQPIVIDLAATKPEGDGDAD